MEYTKNSRELIEAFMKFRKISRRMNYFEELNFSEMTVFFAMKKIDDDHPETHNVQMNEISSFLSISKPALSQIINKLEDKGLVERVFPRSDRRATYVCFTQKGFDIFEKKKEFITLAANYIVKEMGEEDSEKFIELLNKFYNIISSEKFRFEKGIIK
jgi:DNA-binding MarR family transcriptional regulator